MKLTHFRLIVASIGLPVMIIGSTAASADYATAGEGAATAATPATAVADESASTPAATDATEPGEAKPGRLRFRSANGTCACDCAKGGLTEADIRRAEEARANTKN
ncbi:MAG: hypothetical protein WB402_04080 [Sulfuricaulis sp.]|uniref:hypothetical protein n=1 Tax=Sulfuricaulis sp. TaxID=2003553 RepID=UPI003C37F4EE